MNFKKIIFLVFALLIICSSFYFLFSPDFSGEKTILKIVSETERNIPLNSSFYEEISKEFMNQNPNIIIKLIPLDSYEAINYIEKGNDVDGWFISEETQLDNLKSGYTWKQNSSNVNLESLTYATSPLVFLGFRDKIEKLGEITISKLYDTVANKKYWTALNGDPDWGSIKFSHPNAIIYNTGGRLLILLAHNYYVERGFQKNYITKQDMLNNKFKEYVKKFEQNIVNQPGDDDYVIDYMTDYDYDKYDICVFDEYVILKNISNVNSKWASLKMAYPNPGFNINMPFVSFSRANTSLEESNALKAFKDFLLSPSVQAKILSNGLRPVATDIPEYDLLEKQYSDFGFKKSLPSSLPYHGRETYNSISDIIDDKP